ncbi:hypothetical protein [Streptomyces sp. Amel2xC10]|uniref:hypothetical protein n=1 Tax=Streptomyces sp. Amel2xC10 TaxID=1305826 RepID=UPI000A084E09|nr:hypothetical protein [Streptomyces sp. Amel2xC10]SMF85953.1 hypothetical protein SAMN02745830_07092 [Streptomyces sp. Amel2xC10]
MSVLGSVGLAVSLCGFVGILAGRLTSRQVDGLLGIGNALASLDAIRDGSWFFALVSGAICAVCLWR